LISSNAVAVALLIGQAVAFIREMVIASTFGANQTTDAFFVASSIPDLFLQLSLSGAAASALIPLLSRHVHRDGQGAVWTVAGPVIVFYGGISIVAVLVSWPLMPLLVHLLAPGFNSDTANLTVTLGRVMLLSVLFTTTGAALTGILNYQRQFFVPALRFAVQSVCVIAFVTLLSQRIGIASAAVGVVAGSAVALLLMALTSYSSIAIAFSSSWRRNAHVVRDYIKLAVPIMLTGILIQASLFGEKIAASYLDSGSVAALAIARKMAFFAIAIFSLSFQTVLYPDLAASAAAGDRQQLRSQIHQALRVTLVMMITVSAIMWLLATPATKILFQRGMFDAHATAKVSEALRWFAIGIPFFATNSLLVRIYHARGLVLIPLGVGVLALAPYVALLIVLPKFLGLGGVVLALVVADTFRLLMLTVMLRISRSSSA
jgi:putative peptidoglycan lipid II flippase